jgi:hypothetical protein
MKKRILAFLLVLALALGLAPAALATVSNSTLSSAVTGTAKYVYSTVSKPQVGSIGGEWAVLGLARSGYSVPEKYYQDYYDTVVKYVQDCGGVLHDKKYTEYSRVIVALSAIGADARSVGGYDLTKPLGDYDKTIWQGLNGPIWALIALDSGNYPEPSSGIRQKYINCILSRQLEDGGWSLTGGTPYATESYNVSDPDITGMALQALAKYQNQPAVATAINEALDCMSKKQQSDGGFSSMGDSNAESIVQMIVALGELGISVDDSRFTKNGNTLLDALMAFRQSDGGFQHTTSGSGNNQMTAEQGLYALVSAYRQRNGKYSLYRMSNDALSINLSTSTQTPGTGLLGKHADVKAVPVTAPGTTFTDVKYHANKAAIEALASRGIINGIGNNLFDPNSNMTRAQFATIVVRGLGLTPRANNSFTDVTSGSWYATYVGTANTYAIVNGIGGGLFNPEGTITRQEAATMVARAAKLCGMNTSYNSTQIRNVLAQFDDYTKTAEWARESLAFCYDQGILDDSAMNINPTVYIKRCEIAQMLYNMLEKANLL